MACTTSQSYKSIDGDIDTSDGLDTPVEQATTPEQASTHSSDLTIVHST